MDEGILIDMIYRQRDAARAEAADLRRQLAECRADAPKHLRAENQRLRSAAQLFEEQLSAAEDERDALRRQLAAAQAQTAEYRRRVNSVPNHEIASLYDAYAYAVAGWEPGKAESFPAVLRYIMEEFPPEDEE